MYCGRFVSLAAVLGPLALLGCGSDSDVANRPDVFPVTGIVTLGGSPVEGATVTFVNTAGMAPGEQASGRSSVGRTDASGRYELTTFESGDGAAPGEYTVTVTKYEVQIAGGGGTPTDVAEEGGSLEGDSYTAPGEGKAAEEDSAKNLLPEKYASAKTSDLKVTVKADGKNEIPISLEN